MKSKQTGQPLPNRCNTALTILLLVLFATAVQAEVPVNPPGKYYTSWLGNTYMDKNGYKEVTEELNDICVSPNGRVFSAGYAETWGGGAEYNAANGAFLGRYDRFNSGFGDPVSCVAANNSYVYYGTGGYGIMRASHGGSQGPYTTYLSGGNIQGLYLKNGKLYVSDFGNGLIRVLNLSTMVEERNWACANPTRLTVDSASNVWVVIYSPTSVQTPTTGPMWWGDKVASFSATGTPGPIITDYDKPLSVAVDNSGLLLVGGLNTNSQIWKYDVSGTPVKVGTFGADGGIFSGTAGAFTTSAKLHWIKAIVVDASDNIYTGCTYGSFWGDGIEKFNPAGDLQWQVLAGTSLDSAGIDPDNETAVYSKFHHYSLNYFNTKPGTEWTLRGFTMNRFKYPNDNRVDQNTDVGSRSLGAGAYRVGGKLFMARSSQEGYMWELYRQETNSDGEVLVPSVKMGAGSDNYNHFYNATTKTWVDKPKFQNLYNQFWCIAKNGDLFTIADNPDYIIRYPCGGLDENSNPNWNAATASKTALSAFSDIRRVFYDSDTDVMYVAGDNPSGEWGTFIKIRRYDNWLAGNRTASYTVTLPYNDVNYTPDLNYGGGQPNAFYVAGDYMFILYGYGHIRILDKSNGGLVGTLVQNVANGWHGSPGQVDACYGMTVTKRSNGEYVLLFENAAWANIMLERWCPSGDCPLPPINLAGSLVAPGQFSVQVAAAPQAAVLESSTNLATWQPVATNTSGATPWAVTNIVEVKSEEFYRLRTPKNLY